MYLIFGLRYDGLVFYIECLLDYPIDSYSVAMRKWRKVVDICRIQGLKAGLYDTSKGKWVEFCADGRESYPMCEAINSSGLRPATGKTYPVANVPLD